MSTIQRSESVKRGQALVEEWARQHEPIDDPWSPNNMPKWANDLNRANYKDGYVEPGWPVASGSMSQQQPAESALREFDILSVSELPAMVQAKMKGDQQRVCGVLSPVSLCWMSVDDHLFIWPADPSRCAAPAIKRKFSGMVTCVGYVKPSMSRHRDIDGIVHHLLAVAHGDVVQILKLDLCSHEITLEDTDIAFFCQATVLSVTSTSAGRLFIGCQNGFVVELTYQESNDSWFFPSKYSKKNCSGKFIRVTSSIPVPSFVRASCDALQDWLGQSWVLSDPVVGLSVDNSRGLLYALTRHEQGSYARTGVQVFSVNEGSRYRLGGFKSVAELCKSSDRFFATDLPCSDLIDIVALDRNYSQHVHAIAISSTGHRLFLRLTGNDPSKANIELVLIRSPPLNDVGSLQAATAAGGSFVSVYQNQSPGSGTLGSHSIVATCPYVWASNSAPEKRSTVNGHFVEGLQIISPHSLPLPLGDVWGVTALPCSDNGSVSHHSDCLASNEFYWEHFLQPQRFVILASNKSMIVVRRMPSAKFSELSFSSADTLKKAMLGYTPSNVGAIALRLFAHRQIAADTLGRVLAMIGDGQFESVRGSVANSAVFTSRVGIFAAYFWRCVAPVWGCDMFVPFSSVGHRPAVKHSNLPAWSSLNIQNQSTGSSNVAMPKEYKNPKAWLELREKLRALETPLSNFARATMSRHDAQQQGVFFPLSDLVNVLDSCIQACSLMRILTSTNLAVTLSDSQLRASVQGITLSKLVTEPDKVSIVVKVFSKAMQRDSAIMSNVAHRELLEEARTQCPAFVSVIEIEKLWHEIKGADNSKLLQERARSIVGQVAQSQDGGGIRDTVNRLINNQPPLLGAAVRAVVLASKNDKVWDTSESILKQCIKDISGLATTSSNRVLAVNEMLVEVEQDTRPAVVTELLKHLLVDSWDWPWEVLDGVDGDTFEERLQELGSDGTGSGDHWEPERCIHFRLHRRELSRAIALCDEVCPLLDLQHRVDVLRTVYGKTAALPASGAVLHKLKVADIAQRAVSLAGMRISDERWTRHYWGSDSGSQYNDCFDMIQVIERPCTDEILLNETYALLDNTRLWSLMLELLCVMGSDLDSVYSIEQLMEDAITHLIEDCRQSFFMNGLNSDGARAALEEELTTVSSLFATGDMKFLLPVSAMTTKLSTIAEEFHFGDDWPIVVLRECCKVSIDAVWEVATQSSTASTHVKRARKIIKVAQLAKKPAQSFSEHVPVATIASTLDSISAMEELTAAEKKHASALIAEYQDLKYSWQHQ